MPEWFYRRDWRIVLGAIVLVILASVWHTASPAQVMLKSCQMAMEQQLLARTWKDPRPQILSPGVLFPALTHQIENTYVLDSSIELHAGYSASDAFEDDNGPDIKIDYTYRCTIEYTGPPLWGDRQQTQVSEIHVLTEERRLPNRAGDPVTIPCDWLCGLLRAGAGPLQLPQPPQLP